MGFWSKLRDTVANAVRGVAELISPTTIEPAEEPPAEEPERPAPPVRRLTPEARPAREVKPTETSTERVSAKFDDFPPDDPREEGAEFLGRRRHQAVVNGKAWELAERVALAMAKSHNKALIWRSAGGELWCNGERYEIPQSVMISGTAWFGWLVATGIDINCEAAVSFTHVYVWYQAE